MVFSDGTVENRFIHVEKSVSEHELERVHNMLNEVVKGRTLSAIREYFATDATYHADEIATLRQLGLSLVRAATENATRGVDVVIQGQSRLLQSPEFGNVERVRELLFALEDRERLLALLDRTLASTHVNVFLGEETEAMVGFPRQLGRGSVPRRGRRGRRRGGRDRADAHGFTRSSCRWWARPPTR